MEAYGAYSGSSAFRPRPEREPDVAQWFLW